MLVKTYGGNYIEVKRETVTANECYTDLVSYYLSCGWNLTYALLSGLEDIYPGSEPFDDEGYILP